MHDGSRKICRLLSVAVLASSASFSQLCAPDWFPSGFATTLDGAVFCSLVWDDGTGPKLYVGGTFTSLGGAVSPSIAAWDGTSWVSVGGGIQGGGQVKAMCIYDDGTGPALYLGGWFSGPGNNIVKWNGTMFSALGAGVSSGVEALAVYDDGTSGLQLYFGGWFTSSGITPLNRVGRWNGFVYSPVGSGVNGGVSACTVYNNELYFGGTFTQAGGAAAAGLAKYNGTWVSIPGGSNGSVNAFLVYDIGTGPLLYATGLFTLIGGASASRVVSFNGTAWSPLGTGLGSNGNGLAGYDDGTGPALYLAGSFTTAGGVPANRVAKWNGTSWSALGNGVSGGAARTLAPYPTTFGNSLFVGGAFTDIGNAVPSPNVAIWGPSPPIIGVQPVATLAVNPGAPIVLSVNVAGGGLSFQWRHLGVPLPGATSATLTIPSASPTNWGFYDVVVNNNCGGATSTQATVTLNPAYSLTINQPFGPLSLFINHNSPTQPGANYLTTFSFDPINAALPGAGLWAGLHISYNDIIGQVLFLTPPFVGTLDAGGQAFFFMPPFSLPASLSNTTAYAVSLTYNPTNLALINNSNLVSVLLQ